MLGDKQF